MNDFLSYTSTNPALNLYADHFTLLGPISCIRPLHRLPCIFTIKIAYNSSIRIRGTS